MLRLLGALCVVGGTGGLGYLIGRGLGERARSLRLMVAALQHLESEISFSWPILTALRRAAEAAGGPGGNFLRQVAEAVSLSDGAPLSQTWTETLAKERTELLIGPREYEALQQLGMVLGGSDRQDQLKHLALCRAAFITATGEAETQAAKNKRVWQYLGFTCGALSVVFLY